MPKGIYPRNIRTQPAYSWQRHLPELIASIPTEADAIAYLVQNEILQNPKDFVCYYCGYVGCRVKGKKNVKGLKCNRGSCGKSLSLIRGTIFAGSKTPLHEILYISSFFLALAPPSEVISQLHCSSNTVTHWYAKLRRCIAHTNQILYAGQEAKKEHLMKRARKKDALEYGVVAVWREHNIERMWNAFLDVLRCQDIKMIANENIFEDQTANESTKHEHVHIPVLPPMDCFEGDQAGVPMESAMLHGAMESNEWNNVDPSVPHIDQHQQHTLQPMHSSQTAQTEKSITDEVSLQATQERVQPESDNPSNIEQTIPTKKRPKKIYQIPSFLDICCLVPTEEKAVEFLISHNVFETPQNTICNHCGYKGFRRKEKHNPKPLKCNRCNKSQSIARNTFFRNTKSSYRTILQLAADWLQKTPREDTMRQLKCSCATITEFHRAFRKLIEKTMDDELRVMALTADKKAMAAEIPKGARRDELDEHYCVVLWREVNRDCLWDAFLVALREFYPGYHDDVGGTNEVWVDAEKGVACCKYHLKVHSKETATGII